MIALLLTLATVASHQSLGSHADHCIADTRAARFLKQTRTLLSSPGASAAARRAEYGVPAERADRLRLVKADSICVVASAAYAQSAGPAAGLRPPFRVAVVEGEHVYVVELAATAGREVGYWEVVIFDRRWHRLASYGGGA